jgi:predicted RecB family nuclease
MKTFIANRVLGVATQDRRVGTPDWLTRKANGLSVTRIDGVGVDAGAVAQTLEAMKAGAPIIVQGALQAGQWSGRADILQRVEEPSSLGCWSYEVIDTKLARETKGGAVLQICLYTDLLAFAQKRMPEFAHVVVPNAGFELQSYRITHYAAYYRRVKRCLEQAVTAKPSVDLYPDPKPHCDICRWRRQCDAKRRADDHLSLVAGISKSQTGELQRRAINTMAELAAMPIPLQWKPERGASQSYEKAREQARIQVQGRTERRIYETLPVVLARGARTHTREVNDPQLDRPFSQGVLPGANFTVNRGAWGTMVGDCSFRVPASGAGPAAQAHTLSWGTLSKRDDTGLGSACGDVKFVHAAKLNAVI